MDLKSLLYGQGPLLQAVVIFSILSLAAILLRLLIRLLLGKNSGMHHSVGGAVGILLVYAICVTIFAAVPGDFRRFLNQLPLGVFRMTEEGQKLLVFHSFKQQPFPALCGQVLQILILTVSVSLLDGPTPGKLKGAAVVLHRIFRLTLALVIYFTACWIISLLPDWQISRYIPMILLGSMAIALLLAAVGYLLILVAIHITPLFTALYGFFTNDKLGTGIFRAMVTTGLLMGFTEVLHTLGLGTLRISSGNLIVFLLFAVCTFILWLFTGRKS